MATEQTNTGEARSELSDLKRKLAWRMGFAGLMIIALLGGLALFDRLSVTSNEVVEAPPQFTEPVPVPKKPVTQPVTPATPEPEKSAAPVDKSAPPAEPPPRPEVSAQPSLPRPTPSAARPAAPATPAAAPAPARPAAATAATTANKAAEAKTPAAPAAPASPPAQASPQAQAQALPAPPRLIYGYALQAGVFSDPRRAEELHARLMLEGIPSSIEARVEVGPFKTRQEAEAARAKLKALGIDTVLQLPKGGKR